MKYQFIAEHRWEYPITTMCRVLEVSASGYYAWRKREPSQHARSDAELAEQVKVAFQATRGRSGSPRVHAELRAQGVCCARKRVARLMREQDLFAQRPRHRTITTHCEPEAQVLTTVYNCAQIKLTLPRDGCRLWEMQLLIPAGGSHDQEQDSEQDT